MESEQPDQNNFILSYDQYADAIFRYCLFRVYDRERAKELMQETFTKTWEYLTKGNRIDNMRAFLYKVAHNACVNEIKRPRVYSLEEIQEKIVFDPVDEITHTPEDLAEASLLIQKMQRLSPEEKELLTMRYVDDMAVAEIAEFLGLLPNTVSVKIKRAESSLRKLYQANAN